MSNFDCLSCEHGGKCTAYMATGITKCMDYKKKKPEIKDSGERTTFETGAVRDMHDLPLRKGKKTFNYFE